MSGNISGLIRSLALVKGKKKELERQLKDNEKAIAEIEYEIFRSMDAEGIVESKSEIAKVTIDESVVPQVEQWDLLFDHIFDNNYRHYLQKRLSVTAYREELGLGRPVPGVVPYVKRTLKYRES